MSGAVSATCHFCGKGILVAPSYAGVDIPLQEAPERYPTKPGVFVIDDGFAVFTSEIEPGQKMYVPHIPRCVPPKEER